MSIKKLFNLFKKENVNVIKGKKELVFLVCKRNHLDENYRKIVHPGYKTKESAEIFCELQSLISDKTEHVALYYTIEEVIVHY